MQMDGFCRRPAGRGRGDGCGGAGGERCGRGGALGDALRVLWVIRSWIKFAAKDEPGGFLFKDPDLGSADLGTSRFGMMFF